MNAKAGLEARGFPPEGRIFPVRKIDLSVLDGEHPWARRHETSIARHWQAQTAANPTLFNGNMVFHHHLDYRDGTLEGAAHLAPYAAFLHWRDAGRPEGGFHLFGLPLMMSSDNALIAVRMGKHTANAGKVYCAAGSLDDKDICAGRADIDANMRREALEETGIDLGQVADRSPLFGLQWNNSVTLFRRFLIDMPAAEILERIEDHIAHDPEPEIECGLAIRDTHPHAHDYPFFMPPILAWLFSERGSE